MPRAVARWDPFTELSRLRTRLDRMFDEWPGLDAGDGAWLPAIDVVQGDGYMVVRADVPGAKPDEVKIEVEDDTLTISGRHEEHTDEQHKNYVRHERRCGSFSRSVPLPTGIDPNKIEAKAHDGVLEVRIPLPAHAKKETITITPTAG